MKIFICDIYFTTVFRLFFYYYYYLLGVFFSGNGGNVDMRYFYDEQVALKYMDWASSSRFECCNIRLFFRVILHHSNKQKQVIMRYALLNLFCFLTRQANEELRGALGCVNKQRQQSGSFTQNPEAEFWC